MTSLCSEKVLANTLSRWLIAPQTGRSNGSTTRTRIGWS